MTTYSATGGGKLEGFLTFVMGAVLATIGGGAMWFAHRWATSPIYSEYRYLYVAITAALAFIMLRGAFFIFFGPKQEKRVRMNSGGR